MRFFLFLIIFALGVALIALLIRHLAGAKIRKRVRREVHHQRMDEFDTDEECVVLDKAEAKRAKEISGLKAKP